MHVKKRKILSLHGGETLLSATNTIYIVAAVPALPCGNITVEFENKAIIDGSGHILHVTNMVSCDLWCIVNVHGMFSHLFFFQTVLFGALPLVIILK